MANTMPKNHYKAHINGQPLVVDLFDLPYNDFDEQNPLIIEGPVVLSDQSRSTNLTNVHIIGGLDISKQKVEIDFPKHINGPFICRSCSQVKSKTDSKVKKDLFSESFKFPEGTTEIDCTHSIKNFEYFIDRIPSSVKTIIVADSLLSMLLSDQQRLVNAIKLTKLHPNVIVTGAKKRTTLAKELERVASEQNIEQKPQVVEKNTKKQTQTKPLFNQMGDYLSRRDIVSCLILDQYISFFLTETQLDRLVRQMLKNYDKAKIFVNEHGSEMSCIDIDDLQLFYDELFYAMVEAEAFIKEQMLEEQNAINEPKPTIVPKKETPEPVKNVILTPVNIKKHIPAKLWGDIEKICGNTLQTIEFMLDTVSSINTDINETKQGNAVQIIDTKTNTKTSCGYLKKESGNCVVQSIDATTSNDRKRIVWTYLPKEQILACIGVHSEHFCSSGQNKSSLQYKSNLSFAAKSMDSNGEKLTLERINNEKYFDVDVLKEVIKAKKIVKNIQSNNNTLTR